MRIVLAGSSQQPNGIERYTDILHAALDGRGHDVLTFAPSQGSGRLSQKIQAGLNRGVGPFASATAWKDLAAAATLHRADLVHYTYPQYLAPWSGPPSVVSVWHSHLRPLRRARTSAERGERAVDGFLFGLSDRLAFRFADRLAAVSRPAARAASEVHDRVDFTAPFIPESMIVPSGQRRKRTAVVVAYRLDEPRKNIRLAVDAVAHAKVPGLELLMVGELGRLGSLPDFCRPVGPLSRSQVSEVLGESTCLLLPSLYEEFGYVGLEALAAGCHVVAAPLDGYAGMQSSGLQVVDRTIDGFATAIDRSTDDVGTVELPPECRERAAVDRLLRVYEAARNGPD